MNRNKKVTINDAENHRSFLVSDGRKKIQVVASHGKIKHHLGEYVFTKKTGKKIHIRKDDEKKKKILKKKKK